MKVRFAGHSRKGARGTRPTQAVCVPAVPPVPDLLLAAVVAAALAGGCARLPVAASGAEARARFLERAAAPGPTRGIGDVEARVGDRGGSFEARWGTSGDSVIVIGYAGPVRVLDASLLGDSIFVGVRPRDLGISGLVRPEDGLGPEGMRFLLQPWNFGAPWIRAALERASAEPAGSGWRLRGTGTTSAGDVTFALDVTPRGEPKLLSLARPGAGREFASVRYGAMRGYAAARFPRWVEWTRDDARVRLDLRQVDALPEGRLRRLPPAPAEWRVVTLDAPEAREILGRLLGAPPESAR